MYGCAEKEKTGRFFCRWGSAGSTLFLFGVGVQSLQETAERDGEGDDQSVGSVIHIEEVAHLQVRMVPEQGRKLHEQRSRGKDGKRKGHHKTQNIGRIEIAFVHMRKQEGDPDRKEQRQRENGLFAELLTVDPGDAKHVDEKEEGGADGDAGGKRGVLHTPEYRKDGGRVIVEPGANASRLGEIQRKRIQERTSEQYRRQNQNDIAQREEEKVFCLELPTDPEYGIDGQHEHGLELEAEGERGHDH